MSLAIYAAPFNNTQNTADGDGSIDFNTNYSANLMKLVISGNYQLAKLEKLVVEMFRNVKNINLTEETSRSQKT